MAGAGIYIIINTNNPYSNWNKYIGISTNLTNRFNTRLATVTELGFDATIMNQTLVVWGTVTTLNTPPPPAPYANPTPNPVTVTLTWAGGVGPLVAGNWQAVWPVGGVGW